MNSQEKYNQYVGAVGVIHFSNYERLDEEEIVDYTKNQ